MPIPNDLVSCLLHKNVIFFLGAGCSVEPPASFPTADDLALRLVTLDVGNSPDLIQGRYGKDITLEGVCETLWRDTDRFFRLLKLAVRDVVDNEPNQAHRALARLGLEECLTYVVSANVDLYLDRAFQEIAVRCSYARCQHECNNNLFGDSVRHLKVHGDLHLEDPHLLVFTKSQIDNGVEWARVALQALAQENVIVFVGYSGGATYVNDTVNKIFGPTSENIDVISSTSVLLSKCNLARLPVI